MTRSGSTGDVNTGMMMRKNVYYAVKGRAEHREKKQMTMKKMDSKTWRHIFFMGVNSENSMGEDRGTKEEHRKFGIKGEGS